MENMSISIIAYTRNGIRTHGCINLESTALDHSAILAKSLARIELAPAVYKTAVLPLNYKDNFIRV